MEQKMQNWRERKILTCFGAKGANPKIGSSNVMSPFSILLHTTFSKCQWMCFAGFQNVYSGLCVPIVDPEVKEGRVGVLHNFFQVLISISTLLLQSQYFHCFYFTLHCVFNFNCLSNFIFSIAFINFKQIPLFIEFHNCLLHFISSISKILLFKMLFRSMGTVQRTTGTQPSSFSASSSTLSTWSVR